MPIFFADIDECATNAHQCDDICTNTDGSYNCSCSAGSTLDPVTLRKCVGEYFILL